MLRQIVVTLIMIAGHGLMQNARAQTPPAGDMPSPEHHQQASEHSMARHAHQQVMREQMKTIQAIEDPAERRRRMEELQQTMQAMRAAMRASHEGSCTAAGENCAHRGQHSGAAESD